MLSASDVSIIRRHLDTNLSLDATAADLRLHMPYRKTYDFPGPHIDGYHQWLSRCALHANNTINIGIEGLMFRSDALKLYELAFFSGDILEIGTDKGLATTIMAHAMFNSGRRRELITCDNNPSCLAEAKFNFGKRDIPDPDLYHFFLWDGAEFVRHLGAHERPFSLVYIDHAHDYDSLRAVCAALPKATEPDAFVVIRDYNDPRNRDGIEAYGVYQGVRDGLDPALFTFHGIFGSSGVFRKVGTSARLRSV